MLKFNKEIKDLIVKGDNYNLNLASIYYKGFQKGILSLSEADGIHYKFFIKELINWLQDVYDNCEDV